MLQPGELGPSSLCSDGLQGGGARRIRDILQHSGERARKSLFLKTDFEK